MPRGRAPRQPARTGRQDRVARALSPAKPAPQKSRESKNSSAAKIAHGGTDAPSTSSGQALVRLGSAKILSAPKIKKRSRYNPLAPERISEILKRLDQLYPDVKCALTHTSAW